MTSLSCATRDRVFVVSGSRAAGTAYVVDTLVAAELATVLPMERRPTAASATSANGKSRQPSCAGERRIAPSIEDLC